MEHEELHRHPVFAKLEEFGTKILYACIEREATSWSFWVIVILAMFGITAGPAIAIYLILRWS
jgi:hypothetical protein